METIEIKDKVLIDSVERIREGLESVKWGIQHLSEKGKNLEKILWKTLTKEYPEIDGYQCLFNYEEKKIVILCKTEAEEKCQNTQK